MEIYRIYEQATGHAKSMRLKTLNKVSKSICKIIKIGTKSNGTGFFIKIDIGDKILKFLVTAHHFLSKDIIDEKKSIEINLENPNISQKMKLNKINRKIICLEEKDITAIEINEKDLINKYVEYLQYDKSFYFLGYNNYLNKDVFILHYSNGEDLECSSGRIVKVKVPKTFEFLHSLDTNRGASGSPILLFEDDNNEVKVMGIHTSGNIYEKNNIGTFIGELAQHINFLNDKNLFDLKDIDFSKNIDLIMPPNSILNLE